MTATKKKSTWTLWKTTDGRFFPSKRTHEYNFRTQRSDPIETTEHLASDCEFIAALKLKEFYHGRSCHFYFEDIQTGHLYMVQGTEMEEILFNHTLHQGFICGRWGWVRRGGTISIKLLEELDDVPETHTSLGI